MVAEDVLEVRPGSSLEDPSEVRRYDPASGTWSEWIEQGDFIKRTRGENGHREMVKRINEMVKADRERAAKDLTLLEKVDYLKTYLKQRPGTRLIDLEQHRDAERGPLFILARKLLQCGELLEHPKTKALMFKGELPAGEDLKRREIFVRILKDLPAIRDSEGSDRRLIKGELVRLPENTARALIRKGAAEKVPDIKEELASLTTAALEASPGIENASQADHETRAEIAEDGATNGELDQPPLPMETLPKRSGAEATKADKPAVHPELAEAESLLRFQRAAREWGEEAAIAAKREEETPRVEAHEVKLEEQRAADDELLRSGGWRDVVLEALGEDIAGVDDMKLFAIYSVVGTNLTNEHSTKTPLSHIYAPGGSQVGKSWFFRNCGKTLLAPEEFLSFTSISAKALDYLADQMKDPYFYKGKILFVDETADLSPEARAKLKVIMSGGQDEVSNLTVDERHQSKRQAFKGMPTVWSCSAEAFEDAEKQFLNRPLILSVDESDEQTLSIQALQKDQEAYGSFAVLDSKKSLALRLMSRIREVKDAEVLVLFSDYYEPDDAKSRGMIPQFGALVKAIAFSNRTARPTVTASDGHPIIFATFEDGIEATRLWGKFIKEKKTQLAPRFIEVLEALDELPKRTGQVKLDIGDVVDTGKTAEDLTVELDTKNGKGWNIDYVRNMLTTLGKKGLAEYHYCPDGKNRWVALMHPSHTSHFVTYENVTDGGDMLARRILELKRRISHRHTKTGIELPDDLEERILPHAMVPKREKGV